MSSSTPETASATQVIPEDQWLSIVRRHLQGLRYGTINLVVHDGQVVQIERLERTRLVHPATAQVEKSASRRHGNW